jgi:putative SOS response-associated peptidase YedK
MPGPSFARAKAELQRRADERHAAIIRPAGNGRELVMAGWGLVPFWLKPEQLGKQPYSTINARA